MEKHHFILISQIVSLPAMIITWFSFRAYFDIVYLLAAIFVFLSYLFFYEPQHEYGCLLSLFTFTVFFVPYFSAIGLRALFIKDERHGNGISILIGATCIFVLFLLLKGILFPDKLQSAAGYNAGFGSSFSYVVHPSTTYIPGSVVTEKPKSQTKTISTAKPKPTATPMPKGTTYKTSPVSWVELTRTVYVSRNGKIHLRENCSGMKYSTAMSYGEACEKGYDHCKKCF